MFKKLGLIFGPVILAFVLVFSMIMLVPESSNTKHDFLEEQRAANALTPMVFKNETLKQRALSDPNHRFVPFFGSSEWNRMDSFHPSVMAEAYQRPYRPFLLGQRGAQCLTQYFGMQQMTQQMRHKQAVFVISPQWFVKSGEDPAAFNYYFNQTQALTWLQHAKKTTSDQYAAKRLLKMNISSSLNHYLTKIAAGKSLSATDLTKIALKLRFLNHEDTLFADLQIGNKYTEKILPKTKNLPKIYNARHLNTLADQYAKRNTTNNKFGIDNTFYEERISSQFKEIKGSQKSFNYLQSPEYGDLQLILQQFARTNTNVLFVIQPVNEKWAHYTGLNTQMYQQSVDKIKHQLRSQGFKNIADFSNDGNKKYFMQDTIHIGWRGWLSFDKKVNQFLTTKQPAPSYHLNNKYYTKSWLMNSYSH